MLAIAMMCLGPVAAKEKPAPVYELQATGTIEIGPDGQVAEYHLDKGQPAVIENALGRSIAQWRFEPIVVDGKPVIAKTRMRLSLEALPTPDEDYQLRLAGVWFGEPGRDVHHMAPPRYPEGLARAGIGAKAVLVLRLDADGSVQQVHAEQVSLDQDIRSSSQAERWRDLFARASVSAARQWKFDISERLAGEPIGTSIKVPVEFFLDDPVARGKDPGANQWRSYIPGPLVRAPWLKDTAVAPQDTDQLKDGDVRSLASQFKLKDDVVGSML
ncbi:hypothetical protein TI01_1130 [Lysobacter sp. A03]|nr:hypothetical protein TI01_1130 [Lysobacter sp. A03]